MLNGIQVPDFNIRFLRAYSLKIDSLGVDPLQDRMVPMLLGITAYTTHIVVQDERGAIDLISIREYGNQSFWWHIMAYNEIISFRDITEGLLLKIPDYASILTLTSDMVTRNDNPPKTIYI